MPTDTKQIVGEWDSAALVRGVDEYNHFLPAVRPTCDFDEPAVEFHTRATALLNEVLYSGAAQNTAKL